MKAPVRGNGDDYEISLRDEYSRCNSEEKCEFAIWMTGKYAHAVQISNIRSLMALRMNTLMIPVAKP